MLDQVEIPGSDDWWVVRLATRLGEDFKRMSRLKEYHDGTIQVPDGSSTSMKDAYARFVNMGRLNLARLLVQAPVARQVPTGFRTAAAQDSDGDELAMQAWRRSHMATQCREAFQNVGIYGRAYGLVGGNGLIQMLSPWHAVTEAPDATPWLPDAGLTVNYDPIEKQIVLRLFRKGEDGERAYSRKAVRDADKPAVAPGVSRWSPGTDWTWADEREPIAWTSRVPIVPIEAPGGVGQFEPHTDALDRINHTIFQRLVLVAMQAFRQRAIKGNLPTHYPEDHPQAGTKIDYNEIFEGGPAALWMLPEGVDIWESATTDIQGISAEIDKDVRRLAAASSTPLYMLSPDAAGGSAEGAALLRESLVFKVEDLNARAGESLAELLALSFASSGEDERADSAQVETIWMPADRPSWAERAQAASQAATTLPRRTIWREILQLTPEQIARAQDDMDDEAFAGVLNGVGPTDQAQGGTQ